MRAVWLRSAARKTSRGPRPADCDGLGDVEDVVALGDGERDEVDVAAERCGRRPRWRGGVIEAVFAGDELAALDEAEEVEGEAGADDAGALELGGDGHGPGAGGDVNVDCVAAEVPADGPKENRRKGREGGHDQRKQQQGCKELQAGPFVTAIAAGARNADACLHSRADRCLQGRGHGPAVWVAWDGKDAGEG